MADKVLITGASGFVGFHLIEAALHAGLEVYAAVRPTSITDQLRHLPIQFTSFDFSDPESIRKDFERHQYDYVIHAAGLTKARTTEEYNKVNAQYTANLASVAAAYPLKKFVFLSSLAALGPLQYDAKEGIDECADPRPVTDYGRSKLLAEQQISKVSQLPLVILRPTAVYGPREKDIFIMFKTLNQGLEPYIGRKGQWLSFVYVTDLAELAIKVLHTGAPGTLYNVSDGKLYDRYALANISKKVLGKRTIKFHVPMGVVRLIAAAMERFTPAHKTPALNREKLHELTAENWNCAIGKAEQELGFKPKYDLELGLKATLQWYREHKWL